MLDAIHPTRYTYGDYCRWRGDERWELVDGEPWLMSPAPAPRHQALVTELARQVGNFLVGKSCVVFASPIDVLLPHAAEDDDAVDTVVQPDLVVLCDRAKIGRRGIRGAPDWVVEILSPGTATRDQVLKRQLYERHGVGEYWLVDPETQTILVYRRHGERFAPPVLHRSGPLGIFTLPGFTLDWDVLFAERF